MSIQPMEMIGLELPADFDVENLLVYVIGRKQITGMVHQWHFGGETFWDPNTQSNNRLGLTWRLYPIGPYSDENLIYLERSINDDMSGAPWDEARVMIWQIPSPP